jgi:carbon storage regulator
MLVLSRQRDETIMIGDDVEITVVDVRGDKVRLGISAPSKVSVHRKEVYEAILAENTKAAASATEDLGLPAGGGKLGAGASKLVGGRSAAAATTAATTGGHEALGKAARREQGAA